jgi:hypothetical protein
MTGDFSSDPVEALHADAGRQFAFWIQYSDLAEVTIGLDEAINAYIKHRGLTVTSPGMIFAPDGGYLRTNFYGCFWAARLSFFRSDRYRDIFRYFDDLGGIYLHRWDEQKLYALAVALYLHSSQVHFMDYAHVFHQTWQSPQKCCGI